MPFKMTCEPDDYEGPWPDLSVSVPAWKLVPIQPDDNMAGKLARDIVMWWCMSPPTGRMLHRHVRALHHDVPQWLADLIPDREVVPPKGAVACAIYRAMLDAAPAAPVQPVQAQGEPVEIVPRVWREALRKLTFMARTSGGTPGPDEGLQTACAEAETLLSKPYNYPPAAPQQAEPAAQIGWADEFGNLFPMGAWKPAKRTHHDAHKTAWRPVFLHPPAAEVQRLRDAAKRVTAAQSGSAFAINESINALRSALEGGE